MGGSSSPWAAKSGSMPVEKTHQMCHGNRKRKTFLQQPRNTNLYECLAGACWVLRLVVQGLVRRAAGDIGEAVGGGGRAAATAAVVVGVVSPRWWL